MASHHLQHPVHLSTALDTRGGISAVLQVYLQAGFFSEWQVHHVSSHTDRGGAATKAMIALCAAFQVWWQWLSGQMSVLHVHTASGPSFWRKLLIAAPVLLAPNTPVIMHVHGGGFKAFFDRSGKLQQSLIRAALSRSTRVLGLTEEWVQTLKLIAPKAQVHALVNPVLMPQSDPSAPPAQPIRNVVLYLGLLDRKKGAHDLLEAFAKVRGSRSDWKLVLAGSGDIEGLKALAHSLGVADRVIFPGWIGTPEKLHWLQRAACLALPSYAEGLPMAVLEAMAHGIPVIASAVGGLPQVIKPGHTGMLMTPGDIEQLSQHMQELLDTPALRQRLGAAGQAVIAQAYSADAVLASLNRLYESIGLRRPGLWKSAQR